MKMIKRFTDADIDGGPSSLIEDVTRFASRGVLIDDLRQTAMMYLSRRDLYKLPGGGIEAGETKEEAFLREIREETGWEAEIVRELGWTEEHKARNRFLQYSYCFIAKAIRRGQEAQLTENETRLGLELRWMPLELAVERMRSAERSRLEYSTRFMILRDLAILEEASACFRTDKKACEP